jgi:hypothetical protein
MPKNKRFFQRGPGGGGGLLSVVDAGKPSDESTFTGDLL